jgi:hypothetical protein
MEAQDVEAELQRCSEGLGAVSSDGAWRWPKLGFGARAGESQGEGEGGSEREREKRQQGRGLIPSPGWRHSSGASTARRWHPAAMEQTRSFFSSWRKTMKR